MNIVVNHIDTGIMFADDENLSYDAENRLLIELKCTHQNVQVAKDYKDQPEPYGLTIEFTAYCPDCKDLTDDEAELAIESHKELIREI